MDPAAALAKDANEKAAACFKAIRKAATEVYVAAAAFVVVAFFTLGDAVTLGAATRTLAEDAAHADAAKTSIIKPLLILTRKFSEDARNTAIAYGACALIVASATFRVARATKAARRAETSAGRASEAEAVARGEACRQRLRVPTDRGDLVVKGPCGHRFDASPPRSEEPEAGTDPGFDARILDLIRQAYGASRSAINSMIDLYRARRRFGGPFAAGWRLLRQVFGGEGGRRDVREEMAQRFLATFHADECIIEDHCNACEPGRRWAIYGMTMAGDPFAFEEPQDDPVWKLPWSEFRRRHPEAADTQRVFFARLRML
jgi:hypothetical protein